MSGVQVIKTFFESGPDARKVEMKEMKDLTTEQRSELADLSAKALGLRKVVENGKTDYVE